jgi:hypothetical protein
LKQKATLGSALVGMYSSTLRMGLRSDDAFDRADARGRHGDRHVHRILGE